VISAPDFARDIAVNVILAYAAAKIFAELPSRDGHKQVFIFTGNMKNSTPCPRPRYYGYWENATAYMIELAAATYGKMSGDSASFWYFGDERRPFGGSVMDVIDGEERALFYCKLNQQKSQGPWNATFVKGRGYVDFESWRNRPLARLKELYNDAAHEYQGDGKFLE
jgi:hypothetical protein